MRRRDFFKGMAASVAATTVAANTALGQQAPATAAATTVPPLAPPMAPGPMPWMRGLMEVKPLPNALVADAVAQTNAHFFKEQQMATLRRLSEILQPPYKSYPGASDAGAPEFLDFLIGVSPADRQQVYTAGLDRLDSESRHRFGIPFVSVNAAQADQLIRPWLRTWMTDHPPTEPYEHFINVVHSDIRTATINSQAWHDAFEKAGNEKSAVDIYWYPVDPDLRRESKGTEVSPPLHRTPAHAHA